MALKDRLKDTLVVERRVKSGENSIGQDVYTFAQAFTTKAWIQPRTAREQAQANQVGVTLGDNRAYMLVVDIRDSDRVLHVETGKRYEVLEVINAAGKDHHLEVELQRVQASG